MRILPILASLVVVSCGGGSPHPEAAGEPPPAPAAVSASAPAGSVAPAAAPEAGAPTEPPAPSPPPEPEKKLARPAIDTITGPRISYSIDYPSSEPREKAVARCDERAKGDPQKRAECMKKERDELAADVLQFKKDEQERLWWIIYKRKKGKLIRVSRTPVELSEENETTVVIHAVGKDEGTRVLFAGKKTARVTVGDYTLEIDDPRLGRLVYTAKVGMLDD